MRREASGLMRAPGETAEGVVSRAEIVRWALLFAAMAWVMVLAPPLEQAVAFTAIDDGLYYPRLAQNLAAHGRCTYDGVTLTNGFHPLWLILLTPLYAVVTDPFAALRAVYALILGLQLGAVGLLGGLARRWKIGAAGWAVAMFILFLNVRSFTIGFSFLESPLVLVCLLLYLLHAARAGESRFEQPARAFAAGGLIGWAFLARLDVFLLAIAYAAVWLARAWSARGTAPGPRFRSALMAAAGCGLFVAPYLAWNLSVFGNIMTVSSWQKSGAISWAGSWAVITQWTVRQFIPRVQHLFGLEGMDPRWLIGFFGVTGLCGALWMLTGVRGRRLKAGWAAVPEFPVFAGLHAVFIALAAPREAAASAWYWVPEILLTAVSAGWAISASARRSRSGITVAVVLALVAAQAAMYPAMVRRKTMTHAKLEIAKFLREHTPAHTRGMMFDSGIVSYFSRRDFVGLNGLIGDFEQAALMRERRYGEAAARYGVDVLVLDTPEPLLPKFAPHILYATRIRTRFENFQEPPKPFVVYTGSPRELHGIWLERYGRSAVGAGAVE